MNFSSQVFFYDVRTGSDFASLIPGQLGLATSDPETLHDILGGADAVTIGQVGDASNSAVLVGDQFFFAGESNDDRANTALHEVLHVQGGFTDRQFMNNSYFRSHGLSPGNSRDTHAITDWLERDCQKAPSP